MLPPLSRVFLLVSLVLVTVDDGDQPRAGVDAASVSAIPLSGADFILLDPKHTRKRNVSDEERLASRLFRYYDVRAGPRYNGTEMLEIRFAISLASIQKLEEVKQVLHALVWLDLTWTDERLVWNPKHYSGMKRFAVPTKRIWLPDIVLYNSAQTIDTRFMYGIHAAIGYTGTVNLSPYIKVRSFCPLDLTMYPFDETVCDLKFGSWAYDSSKIQLINDSSHADLSKYSESGKWQILGTEISRIYRERLIFTGHHLRNYENIVDEGVNSSDAQALLAVERHQQTQHKMQHYSDVKLAIKMRRRFLFNYHFDIFIPCTIISAITLLCFWLDPKDREKIALAVGLLLTFIVFMLVVNKSIPKTSELVPLICIYLTLTLSMLGFVIALEILLLNVYGTHDKECVKGPVPHWVRVVVLECMAKMLRVDFSDLKKKQKDDGNSDEDEDDYGHHHLHHRHHYETAAGQFIESSTLINRRQRRQAPAIRKSVSFRKPLRERDRTNQLVCLDMILQCVNNAMRIERMNADASDSSHDNVTSRQRKAPAVVVSRSENNITADEGRLISKSTSMPSPALPRKRPSPPKPQTQSFTSESWLQYEHRLLLLKSVTDTISYLTIRTQADQVHTAWHDEWCMVVFVLERFFFYVFFLVLAVSNFILLLWRPFITHLPHGHGTFSS